MRQKLAIFSHDRDGKTGRPQIHPLSVQQRAIEEPLGCLELGIVMRQLPVSREIPVGVAGDLREMEEQHASGLEEALSILR